MTFSIDSLVEAAQLIQLRSNDIPKGILALPASALIDEGLDPRCIHKVRLPEGLHIVVNEKVIDKLREESSIVEAAPYFAKSAGIGNFAGMPITFVNELPKSAD